VSTGAVSSFGDPAGAFFNAGAFRYRASALAQAPQRRAAGIAKCPCPAFRQGGRVGPLAGGYCVAPLSGSLADAGATDFRTAMLLQVLYGIRSERQLMEQLDYNLLYRWFVGLSPDDPVWDPTTFTKNRDRLQKGDVFAKFMSKLLNHPQVKPLLSDEHFSVDGTLIEAWASQKSFRPKDGSGDHDGGANFHGQQRKNDTHASTTDPDCRLYRKAAGREARLCYIGHATMENRHGLAVAGMVTLADGTAERRASETMLKAKAKETGHRITVGEDKAFDSADHVAKLRAINVTPHVAQNDSLTSTGQRRQSAIDGRTTRHEGYGMSQSRRAMIECIFGWGKQHGTMRKTKHRGRARVAADFLLNLIAYNLIRIPKLVAA
jgi:hypothetical protein